MKNEASETLKEVEKKEPLYTFDSVCSSNYTRRVHGFPARYGESNPIKCIPCKLSYDRCVTQFFKESNRTLVNLFHRYSLVCWEEYRGVLLGCSDDS